MTQQNQNEIPAYQAIDIIFGKDKCTIEPKKGFVITVPDSGIGARMYESLEDAEIGLKELQKLSKYPDSLFICKAWIHEQEIINGQISNRKYWSPR